MAYIPPQEIVDALLAGMRAWTVEPLASSIFRKGPVRALSLGTAETAVIIGCDGMADGEVSAGSGNNWHHTWVFRIVLLVPDAADNPTAAEELRFDLLEQVQQFIHENRTLDGRYKVGHLNSCVFSIGRLFEDSQQVFRAVDCTLQYKTLRS